MRTELQGAPLVLSLPPLAAHILRHLDCRTPLALVGERVQAATGASDQAFREQWQQLYAELRGIGSLTLTDVWETTSRG